MNKKKFKTREMYSLQTALQHCFIMAFFDGI